MPSHNQDSFTTTYLSCHMLEKKWSILNCFLFCFVGGGGLVPQLTSSVVWLGCRQKREKVVRCPANSHTTYLSSAEAEP